MTSPKQSIVKYVAWCHATNRIASGSEDGAIYVWEEDHTSSVWSILKMFHYPSAAPSALRWNADGQEIVLLLLNNNQEVSWLLLVDVP
jgi:WD40 repeat protein